MSLPDGDVAWRRNSQSSTTTTATTSTSAAKSGDGTPSPSKKKKRLSTSEDDIKEGKVGSCDPFEEENKAAFGKCSIYDILVMDMEHIPFEVPVSSYLEEVLIGLNCSPELEVASHETRASMANENPHLRINYHRLRRVTSSQALRDSCEALFWIAIGIITNRVIADVVKELRSQLAQHWCLVVLDVNRQVHRDQVSQDFLLAALPAILVQAIYRLLVDGFPEDKPQFVHHVDALLEKLSHIVQYEVSGFHLNFETCLKERKQLFRKVVLDSPYVNQRDSVKAQMRQEFLEHKANRASPLKFGTSVKDGGEALEETQLAHVMLLREDRDDKMNYDMKSPRPTPVPEELSVDRYANIADEGNQLFSRQLRELLPEVYAAEIARKKVEPPQTKERADSSDSRHPESPRSPGGGGSQSPASASRRSAAGDKMRVHVRKSMTAMALMKSTKARAEEQAEKRRRGDQLTKRIVEEPLPPELCERILDTTWVSPITNRLAPGERDRAALRKPSSEAYHLKMELPKSKVLPELLSRSFSAPELRNSTRVGIQELPKLGRPCALVGVVDGDGTGGMAEGSSPVSSPLGASMKSSSGKDVKAATFGGLSKALRVAAAEDLILEPPPRLQNGVVMGRLEAAGESVGANSFGNWVKEFDVTSGKKKTRMDDAAVRKAEKTYIKSLQDLVGPSNRPALSMYDTPVQMAKRRSMEHKATVSGGSPHGGHRRHRAGSNHSNLE